MSMGASFFLEFYIRSISFPKLLSVFVFAELALVITNATFILGVVGAMQ